MKKKIYELSLRHKYWFYFVFGNLFLSGVAWKIIHLYAQKHGVFADLPHPFEPYILMFHGVAAAVALILLGTLLPTHILGGWKSGKNWKSGLVFVIVNLVLIISGYGLYYISAENFRFLSATVHEWIGIGFPIFLFGHIWLGKKSK